ncbi:hypothetical protein TNCT_598391 [Trichonephila clavata]|uniref:Uncharacterized protein n=1 Tax=Trichonephila clavata TaxID=2740835 RepID=A0A8X6J503_TRICU|nr:hypothetical protein TNCT_598391 [Trichonephila clavata]
MKNSFRFPDRNKGWLPLAYVVFPKGLQKCGVKPPPLISHTMICMFYLPRARIDVVPNPPTVRFIDLNQILRGWAPPSYDWDDPKGDEAPTEIRKSRLDRWSLVELQPLPPITQPFNSHQISPKKQYCLL